MRIHDLRVGDLRIAYATAGEGPPLVLLHGGWGDHRYWRRQLEGLSGDFAVAAWDTPGCGRSSDPPVGWRMSDYADCLAAWLDAAGIERPHVLGLSWGGALALELYRRHPAIPSSLVLTGAYAGWAGSLPPDVVAERLARAEGELERPPDEWTRAYIPGFITEAAPPGLADELLTIIARPPPRGEPDDASCHGEGRSARRPPSYRRAHAASLRRAGRALAAARRRGAPCEHPRVAARGAPGCGHLACAERPEEFNAAVRSFLL